MKALWFFRRPGSLSATFPLILALGMAIRPTQAVAQASAHYNRKELRNLMIHAATLSDYQTLASYFHYEKLAFEVKLQKTVHQYLIQADRYSMATKLISRAEVMSRVCDDYSSKAKQNARLASRYDEQLREFGIGPAGEPSRTISLWALESGK